MDARGLQQHLHHLLSHIMSQRPVCHPRKRPYIIFSNTPWSPTHQYYRPRPTLSRTRTLPLPMVPLSLMLGPPSLTLAPVLRHHPMRAMKIHPRLSHVHTQHHNQQQQLYMPDIVFHRIQRQSLSRRNHPWYGRTNGRNNGLLGVDHTSHFLSTLAIWRILLTWIRLRITILPFLLAILCISIV